MVGLVDGLLEVLREDIAVTEGWAEPEVDRVGPREAVVDGEDVNEAEKLAVEDAAAVDVWEGLRLCVVVADEEKEEE